jgi:hypothetical protein
MRKHQLSQFQARPRRPDIPDDFDAESGFEMANLYPETTGLPRTIWVSPRMGQHDIRIKVSTTPGPKMLPEHTVSVGLRPIEEKSEKPQLPSDVMDKICQWATLNMRALQDYWDGTIDTASLIGRLQKLP